MRVNIFKKVRATWPRGTELDKIVNMMKTNQELHTWTQICRHYLSNGDKMGAEETGINHFPAFAPCTIFHQCKARNNMVSMTDLCFLDIDHIKDEMHLEKAMDILRKDPYVMMAARSVSNEGLHIYSPINTIEANGLLMTYGKKHMRSVRNKLSINITIKYEKEESYTCL